MVAATNFKQAVKELFGTQEPDEMNDQEGIVHDSDPSTPTLIPKEDGTKNDSVPAFVVHENRNEESAVKSLKNFIPKSSKEAPMITYPETTPKDQMQTTIISSDTSLTGELNSEGHVEILGSLTGNVKAKGNVKICGKVVGDIAGNDIELFSCKVQGNITAVASVMINNDSVVVGNVIASDMVLDGKLKGDIALDKSIVFKENATLLGKVAAGTISIKEGAKLYGEIQIKDSNKTDALFQEI